MSKFEEIATDCWLTPPPQLELVSRLWPGGIDLDPFHDPQSTVEARERIDVREGGDAYRSRWGKPGDRVFVNGPYSGSNPARTLERCARYGAAGRHILNLCPAAPGSNYWIAHGWPWFDAAAWLGRLPFVAGRDLFDAEGKLTAKQGETVNGNRTEIGLLYTGPDVRAFRSIWSCAGFPVSVSG